MTLQQSISVQYEKDLIGSLKSGNHSAFEEIYKRYSVNILKRLLRFVKDEEIAVELLQDIFLKLWERRESIDIERPLRSYLFRIAENKIIDFFRRAAHDRKLLQHLATVSTELCHNTQNAIDLKDGELILQEAINALPPQRRKIFILCKIEGRTYEEVAEMLGISAGTVNDHMVKAGRTVRKYFNTADLALLVLLTANLPQIFK